MKLPELVCVREFGTDTVFAKRIEERLPWFVRTPQGSLLERSDKNLRNAGEGAALRLHPDVNPRAHEEESTGEEHEGSGDGEAEGPADVGLDVDDDCGG